MTPNVFSGTRMRLLAVTAVIGFAILVVVALTGSPAADAASGNCAGKLIESRNLKVGGKKVGELDVYYNAANGRNCARMNHAGSTWGKKLTTRVWVGICSEKKPGAKVCHYDPKTDGVQQGAFKYYAGPVTTKASAKGRCIAASGYLWIGGTRYAVATSPWVGHCG
jgi:hypothetical protein